MTGEAILVTGGAGYIGSHACKALKLAGFQPVALDNLSTGHPSFVKWGPLVDADVRDSHAVASALRNYNIAAVCHFAANANVGESVTDPQLYYDNNVVGALSLLQAMRTTGCSKIIFSSTCAVYGEPVITPISEAAALCPVNPYGASKLMVERILSDYSAAYDFEFVTLRYFNASGADLDCELGEVHEPETHLIPRAMMALQGDLCDFAVFGSDYDTPDGTAIRDYTHVADIADAHIAALARLLANGGSGIFNLGTGHGYSVREVIEAISSATGRKIPLLLKPRRPGDPPVLIADPSLARTELKFTAPRSSLETIISSAWAWHQRPALRAPDDLNGALHATGSKGAT